MNIVKIITTVTIFLFLVGCENDAKVVEEKQVEITKPTAKMVEVTAEKVDAKAGVKQTEVMQIDAEIRRIEEKLKTKPTVKGWMLVGDAHMYLKRYKEAAGAYNDAYMLSGQAAAPRKKLKNAMYYVGLEKANRSQQ
ncbi:MAG: hypothetical protein COB22_00255 [Cycloclasticus sp.]|nr:MAG: hypothetical protein COB22_00255 [Cycloclasticus sp.]